MTDHNVTDLDVAVIGGGISGLVVADALIRAGRSVRVFEARDRLGGRIHTVDVPGGQADLGPTWFWPGEERVAALVEELGLAVHDQWTAGDALFVVDGTTHRIAAPAIPPAFRFSNGASSLVEGLANRLPSEVVRLSSPVARVHRGTGCINIELADETVTAANVVIALAPSLAVRGGLIETNDLDPALAQVASAVPVWMGAIAKAVAVYERPFWRELGFSGLVSAPGSAFSEIHDMSGPEGSPAMLFGFGGRSPQADSVGVDAFARQLSVLFGAMDDPLELHVVDWSAEAYTTNPPATANTNYDLFGHPVFQHASWDGRLHWTSTETATVAPGHIEGALAAAERTVRALTER